MILDITVKQALDSLCAFLSVELQTKVEMGGLVSTYSR